MLEELQKIKAEVKPHHVLLVVDAMTGQDALTVAERFNTAVGIDAVVLTKMDGDSRGGAALSVRHVTGRPIAFVGVGEKTDALEPFHPDRVASRILGMGDVLSLVEKAQETVDREKAEALVKKLREDSFTLEDFRDQLRQVKQMGPLDQILGMIPGLGKLMKGGAQGAGRGSGRPRALRRHHLVDDAGGAAPSGRHQRQPPPAHRAGQRHQRAGREPAAQAVRAAQKNDEAVQGDGRTARPHEGSAGASPPEGVTTWQYRFV